MHTQLSKLLKGKDLGKYLTCGNSPPATCVERLGHHANIIYNNMLTTNNMLTGRLVIFIIPILGSVDPSMLTFYPSVFPRPEPRGG
jgi:hypothetical protein